MSSFAVLRSSASISTYKSFSYFHDVLIWYTVLVLFSLISVKSAIPIVKRKSSVLLFLVGLWFTCSRLNISCSFMALFSRCLSSADALSIILFLYLRKERSKGKKQKIGEMLYFRQHRYSLCNCLKAWSIITFLYWAHKVIDTVFWFWNFSIYGEGLYAIDLCYMSVRVSHLCLIYFYLLLHKIQGKMPLLLMLHLYYAK